MGEEYENEYTIDIHAKRVRAVIEGEHPSRHCPAMGQTNRPSLLQKPCVAKPSPCRVCKTFIGIGAENTVCPCDYFGEIDAIKRTWVALKKGGYL